MLRSSYEFADNIVFQLEGRHGAPKFDLNMEGDSESMCARLKAMELAAFDEHS
jgi:hypothetical protein